MLFGDLARANDKGCDGIRLNGLMIDCLIKAINVRALAVGWDWTG